MFANVYDELKARGFVEQVTNEDDLRGLLDRERIACYIGFDPTADSLHAGSMVPLMALHHMQRYGHTPIAILGGGTAMIGDPSGKTEMRQLLTRERIAANGKNIQRQAGKFIDLAGGNARLIDNADWLLQLNYIEFLRDIGRHFSVNRMLAAEAYKARLETGLSFIEFNYQVLQAFDYLVLFRKYNCRLQMGGNDQWGNILAGTELIRRVEGADAHALTFPLLTTAGGEKMGKTASGAVWLDAKKLAPYDFYQYWVNVDDRDVIRFLKLLTVVPLEEIAGYEKLTGAALRQAKQRLAFEITAFLHGQAAAKEAEAAAQAMFGGGDSDAAAIPETAIAAGDLGDGVPLPNLLKQLGLVTSASEARRLIRGGGVYLNDERVQDETRSVSAADFAGDALILRLGKKRYHRLRLRS